MKTLAKYIFFIGAFLSVLVFFGALFKGNVQIDPPAFFNSLMIIGIGLFILYEKNQKD
jgi:hypothetical protein